MTNKKFFCPQIHIMFIYIYFRAFVHLCGMEHLVFLQHQKERKQYFPAWHSSTASSTMLIVSYKQEWKQEMLNVFWISVNASRSCLDGGVWAGKTNYKCPPLQTNYSCPPPPSDLDMDPELEFDLDPELDSLDMSIYVYTVGEEWGIRILNFIEILLINSKIHIKNFMNLSDKIL